MLEQRKPALLSVQLQGPVKVILGVIAMKRHHALLPETAGVMALQRSLSSPA
jgi:hypothetical protein